MSIGAGLTGPRPPARGRSGDHARRRYDVVAPHAKKWAFKTMPNASGDLVIQVEHKDQPVELTPEEIVGIMLERMRDTASGPLNLRPRARPGQLTGARSRRHCLPNLPMGPRPPSPAQRTWASR